MSTVRRPFLDAYRHTDAPQPSARPLGGTVTLGSALASGDSFGPAYDQGWGRVDDTHTTQEATRGTAAGTKRPLSSFLHNFDQPADRSPAPARRQNAQWPPTALELLAAAAPAYDKLIARFHHGSTHGSLIGVVGCGPGVGTTTTAICLALRSSTHGASTLLVDADLASPIMAERLNLSVGAPWIRTLREGTPLERAIIPGGDVAVDLLLTRSKAECELDPWTRFHVGNAAGQMRRRYQRTLVDLGHQLPGAVEVIAALAIDEIVVVGGPQTTTEELQRAQQTFTDQGLRVSGFLRAT